MLIKVTLIFAEEPPAESTFLNKFLTLTQELIELKRAIKTNLVVTRFILVRAALCYEHMARKSFAAVALVWEILQKVWCGDVFTIPNCIFWFHKVFAHEQKV